MKYELALVAVIGTAAASRLTYQKEKEYLDHAAKVGRSTHDVNEYERRLGNYLVNDAYINEHNKKAQESGDPDAVILGHNPTSDMDLDEFTSTYMGAVIPEDADDETILTSKYDRIEGDDDDFLLGNDNLPASFDHVALGNMRPVKNQGGCGSCWAFAANSTLEGTVTAQRRRKNPDAKLFPHVSEQQLVDCTEDKPFNIELFGKHYNLFGCQGGWMSSAWKFQQEQGIMRERHYPYQAKETQCAHNAEKVIRKKPKSWGRVTGTEAVKAQLVKRPLSVALAAGNQVFQFYKSGIIRKGTGCETGIDHAVVLTGYDDAAGAWTLQNSWSAGWGDNGFVKIEINEEGNGACDMNNYIYWVK